MPCAKFGQDLLKNVVMHKEQKQADTHIHCNRSDCIC